MKPAKNQASRASKSGSAIPIVTANFALTWDGRVSTGSRTGVDFSSRRDKRRLLEIRASADAVLVGLATVAADNMAMGMPAVDLRKMRLARGESACPLRVVVSNSGRFDLGLKIFKNTQAPLIIFSTTRIPARTRTALEKRATVYLHETSEIDLHAMLATLRASHGIRRLVCEGGPRLFQALVARELIDEVHLTFCPRIFGGARAPTLTGEAAAYLPRSAQCTLAEMEVIGDECFVRYCVKH